METCSSAKELYDLMRLSRFDVWGDPNEARWLFRGQADANWSLLPSAWRPAGLEFLRHWKSKALDELGELFEQRTPTPKMSALLGAGIRARILEARAQFVAEMNAVQTFSRLRAKNFQAPEWNLQSFDFRGGDWLLGETHSLQFQYSDYVALAQHHGVPTRLLDWTKRPAIALAFSVFDENRLDEDGVVFAVRRQSLGTRQGEHPARPEPFVDSKTPSPDLNPASFAQTSVHTFVSNGDLEFRAHGRWPMHDELAIRNGGEIHRHAVPAAWKKELGRLLWADGIDPVALMPSLDGVGNATRMLPTILGIRDRRVSEQ